MTSIQEQKKRPGQPAIGSGPVFDWRTKAGLTQSAAAAKLGCNAYTVSWWERNGRGPMPNHTAYAKLARLSNSSTINKKT